MADSSIAGSEMRSLTETWWDIFSGKASHRHPLPLAAMSTAYIANLVVSEIKFELVDEKLDKEVQRNLIPQLGAIIQSMLVGGYVVVKPYITYGGKIYFDYATSRTFIPLQLDETGNFVEGAFRDICKYHGREYERREHHLWHDGIHEVENHVYIRGTKCEVPLDTVPRWARLEALGKIESDIPMIATIRTPYVNNLDLNSELPISIYANSIGTLDSINYAHTAYKREMKKMEALIFAAEDIVSNRSGKKQIVDDLFYMCESDGEDDLKKSIDAYAPTPREEQYKNALNTELRLYEMEIGVSCGTFTFDESKGLVTATQVLSEDKTTYNTVGQLQGQVRPALAAIAQITATLARYYGAEVADGEPGIEFGDSVFEDTGTEFQRRMQLVDAGLLRGELLTAWYFGVPEEKAKAMMGDKAALFGGE